MPILKDGSGAHKGLACHPALILASRRSYSALSPTAAWTQVAKAKDAASQLAMATRQLDASKAQRDLLESEVKRTTAALRAAQRDLARRAAPKVQAVHIDAQVQAGGEGGGE